MMAYASRTQTRRNVAALKAAGWGWIVGPLDHGAGELNGMPHALDNGAWPAFQTGTQWNEAAFVRAVGRFGPTADFIVVPDVVADCGASLRLTDRWLPELLARPDISHVPLLIAAQDGMSFDDLQARMPQQRVGLFIGGSSEWKPAAIIPYGRWAKAQGRYVHVGRVNTAKRIRLCAAANVNSIDGTSATKYVVTLPMLDGARRQMALL